MATKHGYVGNVHAANNYANDISKTLLGISSELSQRQQREQEMGLRKQAHQLNVDKFNADEERLAFERQSQLDRDNAVKNYANNYSRQTVLDNYFKNNPAEKGAFEASINSAKESVARDFIAREFANEDGTTRLPFTGLDGGEDKLAVRGNLPDDALSYVDKLHESGKVSTEKYNDYRKLLDRRESEVRNFALQNAPVLRGEESRRIFQDLTALGVRPELAKAMSEAMVSGYETRQELQDRALKRYQLDLGKQTAYNNAVAKAVKSTEGKDYKNKFVGMESGEINDPYARKYIEDNINAGHWDNEDLFKMYKAAVNAGADPRLSLHLLGNATLTDITGNVYEDDNAGGNDIGNYKENFVKYVQDVAKARYNEGSSKPDFMETPTFTDPVKFQREEFLNGLRSYAQRKNYLPNRHQPTAERFGPPSPASPRSEVFDPAAAEAPSKDTPASTSGYARNSLLASLVDPRVPAPDSTKHSRSSRNVTIGDILGGLSEILSDSNTGNIIERSKSRAEELRNASRRDTEDFIKWLNEVDQPRTQKSVEPPETEPEVLPSTPVDQADDDALRRLDEFRRSQDNFERSKRNTPVFRRDRTTSGVSNSIDDLMDKGYSEESILRMYDSIGLADNATKSLVSSAINDYKARKGL